jgi:S1-C subfamily serine protease
MNVLRAASLLCGICCAGRLSEAADPAVIEAEAGRVAVVSRVAPAVVAIFGPGGQGGGSGVLISADGFALTNFHVTSGAGNFMKCGLSDGVLYDAVIVGIDPTGDVAIVKLLGRDDFPFVPLGDSDLLSAGDWTFAMGNPFLLATDFHPTVTFGIVSGVHRYQGPAGTFLEYTDCIQIDTSINPGNSGGPLFNTAGELVGINGRGSFEKRGRVNSGAGYAISINQIKNFIDHLRGGLVVDHATLGAAVATRDDGSVVVTSILEQSEAYRRGLREDDEIVSFAGRTIRSVNQFKNILGIYPKGWKLPLVYRREGKKTEILVRLRGLHRQSELTPKKPDARPRPGQPPGDPEPNPRRPGRPGQRGAPERPRPPAPPEHLAKLFIERQGFTNYHFNTLERDRVIKGLDAFHDVRTATGTWKLTAHAPAENDPYEFTLSDGLAGLVANNGKSAFAEELTPETKFKDEPPGSGGLLLALSHLRWLLSKRELGFSELYYAGSEPLDGSGPMVDVLHSEKHGARTEWYFDKQTGALLGSNTERDDDVDPCELRFEGLHDFGGRLLPETIIVRHADREFNRFKIAAAEFRAADPAAAPKPPGPAGAAPGGAPPAEKAAGKTP